ncbi:MAG: 23S rRNA (adenine(2503)-C(2))-methyltransferase RlmN [Acidimicrobiales bacterium]
MRSAVAGCPSPAAIRGAYDLGRAELAELLAGEPAYRVDQVWRGLYGEGRRPAEMTNLPTALRAHLEALLPPSLHLVHESRSDGGRTLKWLWDLAGGARIETVLMRYPGRATVCVSSQAGCAMGCTFCATGQGGFTRQLSPAEIVEQVVAARRAAAPSRLSNVVFMGMGEPLANYDSVWAAISRIQGDLGLSARHITVSTVGVVPGIRRLAGEPLPVNLAVSLHAANDELRDTLVPLNRRYPLSVLVGACRQYLAAKGRRLSFEWALICAVNDRPSDAQELASIARPLGAHVNLIPLNPTPGYPVLGTSPRGVRDFREALGYLGVNATVRQNRGRDIDAACGQLAASIARGAPPPALARLQDLPPCRPSAGSTAPSPRPS